MPVASGDTEQGTADTVELMRQFEVHGVVTLPTQLDADLVERLRSAFMPLLENYVASQPPNRGAVRHQMYLPFRAPFDDPGLWADPTVIAVVEALLGPDAECTYYGSDTPYPGAEHQPTHQDGAPLFPDWAPRPPPYCIAMNVPLVDVDETNGPFEWFDGAERPEPDAVPHRVTGPAGTVLLRDTRVWHRGSPHDGTAPRPMLALLYTRSWYRFPLERPVMDQATYLALDDRGQRLFRNADIADRPRAAGDQPRLAVRT